MDLYVGIVAHIKREEMAYSLAAKVQADEVFMDNGMLGEWRNHEKAWRAAERSGKTHAVILQDDALPVENFREHALEAAKTRSERLISLYVGTHRPRKEQVLESTTRADRVGAAWLTADTLMWGVGVLVPTALISEILDTVKKSNLPYDQRIGLWAEETSNLVYYTWPSLVDHVDEPTVIPGRPKKQGKRVAHRHGVPEWNTMSVHIERPSGKFLQSKNDHLLRDAKK